jgi:hypothetical protein
MTRPDDYRSDEEGKELNEKALSARIAARQAMALALRNPK